MSPADTGCMMESIFPGRMLPLPLQRRPLGRVAKTLRIEKLEWIRKTPGKDERISL